MKWTEGRIHVAMRRSLKDQGWRLIAGELPGGSDHELYPLNVVDPALARDESPDPRRHSLGELIPDIVALHSRHLLIGEAKVLFDDTDRLKLENLLSERREHLLLALRTFARDHDVPALLPIESLVFHPALIFRAGVEAPQPSGGLSYLRIASPTESYFEGPICGVL